MNFQLYYYSGCRTVTRELVAPAYFSAFLRRSLVTQTASAVCTCVGDRLTAAYITNTRIRKIYDIISIH